MHILATFATLCCQTRWPRNHSCTTQEHVSFFRTFSGHFRKFRLFRVFLDFRQIWQKVCKSANLHFTCSRTFSKTFSQTAHKSKNISRMFASFCKCANVQMCKCANVQKCVVHKMRKSAAQIIFQMQKSQICTVHKSANATFCACHNFYTCN